MTRLLPRLAAALVVGGFAVAMLLAAQAGPGSAAQRANHLDSQLRCPVCQGLSVADSHSSTSLAIAADVRRRVAAGQSDDEIRSAYVARYGQWILLEPGGRAGAVAWALPIAGIAGAVALVAVALRRWASGGLRTPTDAERALVERARHQVRPSGSGT